MALTENWIILILWPFESNLERMKAGGHHYAYNYDQDVAFIVIPRRPRVSVAGWNPGEYRVYYTKNCMIGHTAGGWETDDGKLIFECSRTADNFFPFFPSEDGRKPDKETKVDFVRYEIDLSQPTGTKVLEPRILFDTPNEFPRIDERFMAKKYEVVLLNIFYPGKSDTTQNVFAGLNAVMHLNTRTGVKKIYWPGEHCFCQEPLLVPRSDDAPEGDGYVMFMVERRDRYLSYLVVLDTDDFEKPIAVADIPFRLRPQIHGNWVDARELSGKPLIPVRKDIKLSEKAYSSYVDLSDAKPLEF